MPAAQPAIVTARPSQTARAPSRSGANASPAAAASRIAMTPSRRSISTDAKLSCEETPARASRHARMASPPTLGMNVPMKVVTKKMRRSVAIDGRVPR
jgi:hypothetical protein